MAPNAISLCLYLVEHHKKNMKKNYTMSLVESIAWSEKFLDEVGIRGGQIPRYSRFPLETRPF